MKWIGFGGFHSKSKCRVSGRRRITSRYLTDDNWTTSSRRRQVAKRHTYALIGAIDHRVKGFVAAAPFSWLSIFFLQAYFCRRQKQVSARMPDRLPVILAYAG